MLQRAIYLGWILQDELDEQNVASSEFARKIDVPPDRIGQIIAGKRSITADSVLLFGRWFGVDPWFEINLQRFDLGADSRRIGAVVRRLPTESSRTSGMAR